MKTNRSGSPKLDGLGSTERNSDAFSSSDWGLLLFVSLIWGSSFLWIAIGLESFSPASVAFLRTVLGALALLAFPGSRRRVDRSSWPAIAVVAVTGNAGPALLIAFAQQRIESSVAGMINAATPLAALLISLLLTRIGIGRRQTVGLFVGFAGVLTMASPSLFGAKAEPIGVLLMLGAVLGYGISNNVVLGLQQRYGGPAVVLRALVIGSLLLLPLAGGDLVSVRPSAASVGALVFLGLIGTGMARSLHATLVGGVGPSRAALVTYLVPVVAIALGLAVRGESIHPAEYAGTALVLLGASLTSGRRA